MNRVGCGSCACTGCPYCVRERFTDEACDCPEQTDGCGYCGCPGCGDCIDDEIGPCGCHQEAAAGAQEARTGVPRPPT